MDGTSSRRITCERFDRKIRTDTLKPCSGHPVYHGTIPPGVSVPIHSHAGIEAFYVLSGEIEVLSEEGGNARWIKAGLGDFIEVPSNAKHGFKNRS
jgi:quercetin dioxygenase-like cupin family protein